MYSGSIIGIMAGMKTGPIIIGLLTIMVFGAIAGFSYYNSTAPGKLDGFTQCLSERGAMFYGAFWCQHCQNQKALFGRSAKLLPYVECSTPDAKGQLPICIQKEIKGYPTWIFADGSREDGEVPLVKLAEKTQCELPE